MTSDVEKWLESLPERSIEEELERLRAEAAEINRRIEVREQALAMKRSFAGEELTEAEGQRKLENQRAVHGFPAAQPLRGREAIRQVIQLTPNQKTWTIPDMLAAIHRRGWAANTHAVQVNLSRMYRDGELGKEGMGVYVVPGEQNDLLASSSEARE